MQFTKAVTELADHHNDATMDDNDVTPNRPQTTETHTHTFLATADVGQAGGDEDEDVKKTTRGPLRPAEKTLKS